jgi:hypothetical protein
MLMFRADWDTATKYGSYWIGRAQTELIDKGMIITDLSGDLANKDDLLLALASIDPMNFWGMGHGNETQFAGQNNYVVMQKGVDEALMVGRIVHLTSCLTGAENGLLQSLADAGALACFGYNVEFIVGVETPNFPAVSSNDATKSLMKPDTIIELLLAGGLTCAEALAASDFVSNSEIEYWRASGHPDADLLIFCLIHNRDGKAFYGEPHVVSRLQAPAINGVAMAGLWLGVVGVGLGSVQLLPKEVAYVKA